MAEHQRLYTVQGQRPTRTFDAGDNMREAHEVTYVGPNGIQGRVIIENAVYTAENVDRLIRADLAEKLQIAQLGAE